MGVGLDQSPHYFSISSKYRKANPETSIGKPGDLSQVGQLNIFLHKHSPGSEHWGGTVQFGWDAWQWGISKTGEQRIWLVLEDLERSLMNIEQACAEAQVSLAEEFMLEGTVGDQDWLTLLAWKQPHLVYTLPCQFNVQTDQVLFLF